MIKSRSPIQLGLMAKIDAPYCCNGECLREMSYLGVVNLYGENCDIWSCVPCDETHTMTATQYHKMVLDYDQITQDDRDPAKII